MMSKTACVQAEIEYREWSECRIWYCVKTRLANDGSIECEIAKDEKTNVPIIIQSQEKPLDGVFEDETGITYFTYQPGYAAAAQQVEATRKAGKYI